MRERRHSLTWLILKLTEVLARDVHIRAGPTGCDSKFAECRRRSCTYSKLAALRRPVACKVHRRWRSFRQLTIHCDARADQSRSDTQTLFRRVAVLGDVNIWVILRATWQQDGVHVRDAKSQNGSCRPNEGQCIVVQTADDVTRALWISTQHVSRDHRRSKVIQSLVLRGAFCYV